MPQNPTNEELARKIKQRAAELGFDLCGIAPAVPSAFKAAFRAWLERGYHGEMAYMARNPERRLDPDLVLPGARSIVVVGLNYYTESGPEADDPDRAIFARYARGDDYHDVMLPRLQQLLAYVKSEHPFAESALTPNAQRPTPSEGRCYVDTGPILEREAAQRAGLGWFGKNTMLINTRRGSYFLLGEILLSILLPPDEPARGGCGTCRRCIDACPTGAIVRPYEVDARRCISYLTIELKGPIPAHLAPHIGNRVFGCDICQEVCPFNHRTTPTTEPAFLPREAMSGYTTAGLLAMDEDGFRSAFRRSPVKRAKRRGLLRNAAAALSSREEPDVVEVLEQANTDPEPLVREQARDSLQGICKRQTGSRPGTGGKANA